MFGRRTKCERQRLSAIIVGDKLRRANNWFYWQPFVRLSAFRLEYRLSAAPFQLGQPEAGRAVGLALTRTSPSWVGITFNRGFFDR